MVAPPPAAPKVDRPAAGAVVAARLPAGGPLRDLSTGALYDLARARGIAGRSLMSRAELLDALTRVPLARAPGPAPRPYFSHR